MRKVIFISMTMPNGYLNRKIAESVEDAVSHYSVDHIKTLVKSSIQRYIESFMNKTGGNRNLYEALTKQGLQYITDKSFDPTSDQSLRKTQIARLFEQIRQELPCVLIMDSSFEYLPMNFSGIDKAWSDSEFWYGQFHIARNLRIMLVGGTRDQSSTDFLHGLFSVLFGELRHIAGGNTLRGNRANGETWAMTMGSPILGKVSQDTLNDDPKDKIWHFDIEIPDILFEDDITIKMPLDKVQIGEGILNPKGFLSDTPPVIHFPDTILMNQPTEVLIDLFQPEKQQLYISDPNVASYNPHSRIITARRPGTFKIQIMRKKKETEANVQAGKQTGATLEVLAEKTVRVLFA